jgi:hypothetical protein
MRTLAVVVLLAACGDDATMLIVDASGSSDSSDGNADAPSDGARLCLPTAATYPLMISAGAFPPVDGHPNVIVYQPPQFDPAAPIDLVVYIHGFNNCIENVIGDMNTECTPGGGVRPASQLASQLDASGRNALLIVPEVAYDMASGNPGQLGVQDGFRDLLTETLLVLPAPIGPIDLAKHGRVIVASHSGGYTAASSILAFGGVPVDEVWLLDSLYAYTSRFEAWIMQDLPSFTTLARRFADVYTSTGGTDSNSIAMADHVATYVDPSVILDDRTTATLTDAQYHHGIIFKHSALSHHGVTQYYVERLLSTSELQPTCP